MIPVVVKGAGALLKNKQAGKGGFANVLKKTTDILTTYQAGKTAQAKKPVKKVVAKPAPAQQSVPSNTFKIMGANVPKPVVYIGVPIAAFFVGRAIYKSMR